MDEEFKLTGKNLRLLIILLGILLIIPLTLFLLGQRQELRKRAGEFPPAVVFVPQYVKTSPSQTITLTLLLQGAGLQTLKFDGADIVFTYPSGYLELVSENGTAVVAGGEAVIKNQSLPGGLEVFWNKLSTGPGNNNTVVFSLRNKVVDGKLAYTPVVDPTTQKLGNLVLGTVKFKALAKASAYIEFDDVHTVVAGGGVNTTNFDIFNVDKRNVLAQIKESDISILRAYPSNVSSSYQEFSLKLKGENFRSTYGVLISPSENQAQSFPCGQVTVSNDGQTMSCNVPAGKENGTYDIKVVDPQLKVLAFLEKGLSIYQANTPIVGFSLRFFGVNAFGNINSPAGLDYLHPRVRMKIVQKDTGKEFIKTNVLLTAKRMEALTKFGTEFSDTDNIDDRFALVGLPPGRYDILVKGPKHVQRKFTVDLVAGNNVIDRSSAESNLMGGDLPLETTGGQDGRVNAFDYHFIINHYDSRNIEDLNTADLNFDGGLNTGDMSVVAETLGEQKDEDE